MPSLLANTPEPKRPIAGMVRHRAPGRHTGSPYLCSWCGLYDADGMTASGGHPICDACWDEGRDGFAPIYTMEGA